VIIQDGDMVSSGLDSQAIRGLDLDFARYEGKIITSFFIKEILNQRAEISLSIWNTGLNSNM
jgi:hypothetical protein